MWHAFSDLFLDTELQPHDYRWIAGVLRSSGYSSPELHIILSNEVAPAFAANLLAVAGEWAGWNEEEVRGIVLASLSRRLSPFRWIAKRLARRVVAEEWQRLETELAEG